MGALDFQNIEKNSENFPSVFTSEELEKNIARKSELIELIKSQNALVIVGAGSSALVGYDTWPKLLGKLEKLACECGNEFVIDNQERENQPLIYAQNIKDHISKDQRLDEYYNLLYEEFKPRNPAYNSFHKTLVKLPFKGILTANYDIVLEAALSSEEPDSSYDNSLFIKEDAARRVSEFLISLDFKDKCSRRIAHLHGVYNRPKSIVLCADDYANVYNASSILKQWSLHRKLLWAVLATRRVVFIGFSMKDPYFDEMLELVSSDLWRWNESIHYAIMDISGKTADDSKERAQFLRKKYGIEVVFYENLDGSHRGMEQIVNEASVNCGIEPEATNWFDMVNQRMEQRIKLNGN